MEAQVNTLTTKQTIKKRKSVFSVSPPSGLSVPSTSTSSTTSDGINLSTALTALKASLKRDCESLAPPTPAVSSAHGRNISKRTRFDFEELDASEVEDKGKINAAAAPKTVKALLAVSNRMKFELEKRRRCDRERSQTSRRRKHLSYFAIVGAFQRAAHEREVAMQLECVVKASTD
ncbi:hypothetical protein PsorP6_005754 [Peronosclerospora sorghi]|uniref:Uncharacterized protein n=1 Tax=Peronosclerospora sorghi TaxID=230839 RepID=A0ACC0W5X8_9STRA|nr:hypothetical protein PsorP6_005754 [Peronosclerospora sorghi]